MVLNRANGAAPGPTKFSDNRRIFPVVVSAKRFDAIIGRSKMDKKEADLAQAEEDRRYMQYLKDGSDWVCSHFSNVGAQSLDEERKAKVDEELREAEILEKQVRLDDERHRKERVMRANRILEDLKAGQRALYHANVESEVIHQRRYNEALNREIAEDARRQQRLDEEQCPEELIPFFHVTEEEEKAKEQQKALEFRTYLMNDLEERRLRRLAVKKQEEYESIVERAQYKCLEEMEKKAAEEKARKKREFCCRAYQDALKEKAEIKKYEHMCDQIDDRVICVDVTTKRNLDARYNKDFKAMIQNKIKDRENRAIQICRQEQAKKQKEQELRTHVEKNYDAEVEVDAERRQCEIEKLAKQRRAYELVERKQNQELKERNAQIRRFEVAERFKTMEANKHFYALQKQQHAKATADLRHTLHGQHEEFLKQRQAEQMRLTACQEDPYLKEDVNFFQDAVRLMSDARKVGRPVFPMVTAVELYKRKNHIDFVPEGRMVGRRKQRDNCWPGFYSKAELAYKKYEHREKCRQETEKDRHGIFANCIKITKMAAEEQPYKKCVSDGPIKCMQHCGLPAIKSVDSFDIGGDKCHEGTHLEGGLETMTNFEMSQEANKTPSTNKTTQNILSPTNSIIRFDQTPVDILNSKPIKSNSSSNRLVGGGLSPKLPSRNHIWR